MIDATILEIASYETPLSRERLKELVACYVSNLSAKHSEYNF